jgi:hypothetical protein
MNVTFFRADIHSIHSHLAQYDQDLLTNQERIKVLKTEAWFQSGKLEMVVNDKQPYRREEHENHHRLSESSTGWHQRP